MRHFIASLLAPILIAAAPTHEMPLPVGRILWGQSRATGFMIDRCTLVTARHAAPPRQERIGASFRIDLLGMQRGAKVVALGRGPDMRMRRARRASDWLIARLDHCLHRTDGYFRLLAGPVADSALFFGRPGPPAAAGFAGGQRKLASAEYCPFRAVMAEGTIEVGCAMQRGYSGGPLFVRLDDGSLLAIGIVSAGDASSAVTLAAPVTQLAVAAPRNTFAESPGAALAPINRRNPTSPVIAARGSDATSSSE